MDLYFNILNNNKNNITKQSIKTIDRNNNIESKTIKSTDFRQNTYSNIKSISTASFGNKMKTNSIESS